MSPPVISSIGTIADAIRRVEGDAALKASDRREMASALRCLTRVARRPAETIPAKLHVVRDLFDEANFVRAGLSVSYRRKVRCLVMRAMRHCGVRILSARCNTEATPEWNRLISKLNPYRGALFCVSSVTALEKGSSPLRSIRAPSISMKSVLTSKVHERAADTRSWRSANLGTSAAATLRDGLLFGSP